MKATVWWCVGAVRYLTLLVFAAPVLGQTPTPSPSATPKPGEVSLQQPEPRTGPRSGRAGAKLTPSAETGRNFDGPLRGARALRIGDGEARLMLQGVERVLKPGTVIGTDTVKSITPGRMVLRRSGPEAEGGDAIVIVTFDGQGRTLVRVLATKDPTARVPGEVK